MKQVVQPVSGGPVEVLDVPRPVISPAEVLVRTVASVISPGTEAAVTALARSSLLAKARARPDLVRQAVRKAQAEGVAATARAIRGRLATDLPLGYSAAGVAVEVGAAVTGIKAGQLVATGGAGKASHAEFQAVPGLLCAAVPEHVPAQDAAFATLASIPLHALRLSEAGPGAKVVVLGLGLLGQLAARLAMASGCDVAGIDPDPFAIKTAAGAGVLALAESGAEATEQVLLWSRGRGADAVLVCAADSSPGPMTRTPELCRDRATVVMVGDVGMPPRRAPFYQREISLLFARSYGPGRYEPSYEAWGVDYPAGQVRWTEGRNQEAVLDLLAAGQLRVDDLVTHSFGIDRADEAFRLLEERTEPRLAIRLSYPAVAGPDQPVRLRPGKPVAVSPDGPGGTTPGVGWIGAGAFATGTLLPAFRQAGFERFVAVATASGISARRAAERHGFEQAVSGAGAVIDDPDVSLVVIATPHDVHADLAARALTAGRDVWCEKPLALTRDDLDEVEKAWRGSGRQLALGFNRRWAPAVQAAQRALAEVIGAEADRLPDRRGPGPRRPLVPGPAPRRAPARRGLPLRRPDAGARGRRHRGRDQRAGRGRGPAGTTASRWPCGSRTARSPLSPTAAPCRWLARSGSRCWPDRTRSSSTTSAPSWSTAGPGGRAGRTRATAPTPPRSCRRCGAVRRCRPRPCWATMRATIAAADQARAS